VAASAQKIVALVFLMVVGWLGSAQEIQKHGHVVEPSLLSKSPRLISLDEGMAIIGAALQARYQRHPKEDCSHLVHAIYQKAGFPYSYADSRELYEGVDGFRQVTHSQPGDLVVWKGHAAIVVNPAQHTFFSSTRTGLQVQSYDLMYWKRRGTPRFFRYTTIAPPSLPSIIQTTEAEESN
jgi:cell wall-associated NlpC family hydrolase